MPIHNKLVRNKIPQIIQDAGKTPVTKILNEAEYIMELHKKSDEELKEYLAAETNEAALEELADLLEIIHALAKTHDSSIEEVEKIRVEKAAKRGGFSDKVFLIEVKDD
ncbi:nucleoside triphosphate pyrophosphohydrolase [Bacillus sp. V3B]|uniref:nucleoside triphosphate pyrophosphohydrolase n=1 Tax=Bacillus sp. V3B TaxID=2804915 RepID=UPI00210D2C0A|nr:nucleoside triphosphate pyrophosphohydrolase [Bacillus sp. V3B]MCQ6277082.1 nucleoside triphosphate pyrophosphohydrolase [Bacillus sp. V3B]